MFESKIIIFEARQLNNKSDCTFVQKMYLRMITFLEKNKFLFISESKGKTEKYRNDNDENLSSATSNTGDRV